MKRILDILLCCCLALAGCSSGEGDKVAQDETPTQAAPEKLPDLSVAEELPFGEFANGVYKNEFLGGFAFRVPETFLPDRAARLYVWGSAVDQIHDPRIRLRPSQVTQGWVFSAEGTEVDGDGQLVPVSFGVEFWPMSRINHLASSASLFAKRTADKAASKPGLLSGPALFDGTAMIHNQAFEVRDIIAHYYGAKLQTRCYYARSWDTEHIVVFMWNYYADSLPIQEITDALMRDMILPESKFGPAITGVPEKV